MWRRGSRSISSNNARERDSSSARCGDDDARFVEAVGEVVADLLELSERQQARAGGAAGHRLGPDVRERGEHRVAELALQASDLRAQGLTGGGLVGRGDRGCERACQLDDDHVQLLSIAQSTSVRASPASHNASPTCASGTPATWTATSRTAARSRPAA